MDCCRIPDPAPQAHAAGEHCRRCGTRGRRVSHETMDSLLEPVAHARRKDAGYFFDRSSDCDIVYFSNEADSYFTKDELTVRVGIKEKEPPIVLCYCFGHTAEAARQDILATGRTAIPEKIEAEIQAGHCSCEVKNPSGKCCLGDVNRRISEIQKETAREPVAETERG